MIFTRYTPSTGEYSEYDDGLPSAPVACFCPCCGIKTLISRNWYEVCPVCYWEDNGQDDHNSSEQNPCNHLNNLDRGRKNYLKFGVSAKELIQYVRPPTDEERVGAKSYRDNFEVRPETAAVRPDSTR